jgi:hypothetical protein
LLPGEEIECDIIVPNHIVNRARDVLCLRCRAQVLRVEKTGHGDEYGLACRIESYRVLHGNVSEAMPGSDRNTIEIFE